MLGNSAAFSGFSVDDIPRAKQFYADTLGLEVSEENGMLTLQPRRRSDRVSHIPKDDQHEPAAFTILNFPVPDIEPAVDELTDRGVSASSTTKARLRRPTSMGVFRGDGPLIAWFKDPAGNVLSVIRDSPSS